MSMLSEPAFLERRTARIREESAGPLRNGRGQAPTS